MPPKAGGIHFRQPHFKLLGSPHDGYHRVGRGAIWTGAISSIPRPSPLPPDTGAFPPRSSTPPTAARRLMPPKADGIHFRRPHWKSLGSPHDGNHRVGRGATWTGATSSIPRPSLLLPELGIFFVRRGLAPATQLHAITAMTEQVPPTPPHQRRIPLAESIRGRRPGDGSTSGPGDGRGPLPAPEGPRARHPRRTWVAPRKQALSSRDRGRKRLFADICRPHR